jgi:hypothetical protein
VPEKTPPLLLLPRCQAKIKGLKKSLPGSFWRQGFLYRKKDVISRENAKKGQGMTGIKNPAVAPGLFIK